MNKANKKKIVDINQGNDIKYVPPLSYRHLRIFAWAFLVIGQAMMLLSTGAPLYNPHPGLLKLFEVLGYAGSLVAPLFLIAAFSVVLNAKNGYRRLFIVYGGATLLIYGLFLLFYSHYIIGLLTVALGYEEANTVVETMFSLLAPNGYLSFNIFVDLLLCTAVTFFLNYNPSHHFKDKKIYIFRSLVAIPILYEVISITLKILSGLDVIDLTPYLYPLLTTKPPVAFIIFITLAVFVKVREHFFIKRGKTHRDYKLFEQTNSNKLHFSIFLSIVILIAALIDTFLLFMVPVLSIMPMMGSSEEAVQQAYMMANESLLGVGIGHTIPMIFAIPIIMLFDYKKTYKNNLPDIIIPTLGVILLVVVYLEVGYIVTREYLAELIRKYSESQSNSQS